MAKLSKPQVDKKEKIVKAMKRSKDDFSKRYGDDAKSVMYATATKLAKNESVEYVVDFTDSIDASNFANAIKEYSITSNECISTERNGSARVFFESKIDNHDFIEWLADRKRSTGTSLCFEDFLPETIASNPSATTFSQFSKEVSGINYDILFEEAVLSEADDAYKKTREYKRYSDDDKEAIDYFMSQIEKHGIEKLEKVARDTTVRYPITPKQLDNFLENIFFVEDIEYIRSLTEAEDKKKNAPDPVHKKAEDDRKEAGKKNEKAADDKKKDADKKKSDADKKKSDTAKANDDKSDGGDNKGDGIDTTPKTFANFKSDLKPGEKGKPSIVKKDQEDKSMKLEKPQKGSPIKDAEIDETE